MSNDNQDTISNEQLYQELRKNHRRISAGLALICLVIAWPFLLADSIITASVPVLAALLFALHSIYVRDGRFRRLLSIWQDPVLSEPELKNRLGDPYETKEGGELR